MTKPTPPPLLFSLLNDSPQLAYIYFKYIFCEWLDTRKSISIIIIINST